MGVSTLYLFVGVGDVQAGYKERGLVWVGHV